MDNYHICLKADFVVTGPIGVNDFNFVYQLIIFSCKIDWKKGKNVTVKTVKKKQKHKGSGTTRTITKTVQSDSFFNFFSPPSRKLNFIIKELTLMVEALLNPTWSFFNPCHGEKIKMSLLLLIVSQSDCLI